MIRKALIVILGILIVAASFQMILNMFSNSLNIIQQKVTSQIETTLSSGQRDYTSWLWDAGRGFSFDVVYMNIFSPGSADFSLKKEIILGGQSGYVLQASLNESDLFKKIYPAQMQVSSQIAADTKVPLIYRETTVTMEKEKVKEIRFYPVEKIAEREGSKFKIPDKTHDPLSAFFSPL